MRLAILLFVTGGLISTAYANAPSTYLGTWVLRIGDRNLFVLKLETADDHIAGSFDRPSGFLMTGGVFAIEDNATRHSNIVEASLEKDAFVFTVVNEKNALDRDRYRMRVAEDQASLSFADIPPEAGPDPWIFHRAIKPQFVANDWQPNRSYVVGDTDTSNDAMKAIFDADQAARQNPPSNWDALRKADSMRREKTTALLAAGALHTGDDFERAAFIFQHGENADDYLLAHTLALIAVSKGRPLAVWIASATLDRYLQSIGKTQIYGTQFHQLPNQKPTQEPYNRKLISDALRSQLGVPSQAAQEKHVAAMAAVTR